MKTDVDNVIRERWGIETLRPLQREAIDAVVAGRDLLTVMPTGHGKSLCYQAPAAVPSRDRKGETQRSSLRQAAGSVSVVVTPLIALMEDQLRELVGRKIPAACLHSNQDPRHQVEIERAMVAGAFNLIYCSPERLTSPPFITLLKQCRVRNFVIDEAHCISQWGHDFRPAYAALANLRKLFPAVPVQAFTATATPKVRDEIVETLGLRDPVVLVGAFDRPNLHLSVRHRDCKRADSSPGLQIIDFARARPGQDGIVYCPTRRETEMIAAALSAEGIAANAYHAGLDAEERHAVQEWFTAPTYWPGYMPSDDHRAPRIVVATIAFGMGINKPDVRWIVHASMPSSAEVYHQEIGRAGRDGRRADCAILYHDHDFARWEQILSLADDQVVDNMISGLQDPAVIKLLLLHNIQHFCIANACRHRMLVEYFGQTYDNAPAGCTSEGLCLACDVCDARTNQNRDSNGAVPSKAEGGRRKDEGETQRSSLRNVVAGVSPADHPQPTGAAR